jgi:hypothetical protein
MDPMEKTQNWSVILIIPFPVLSPTVDLTIG